MQGRRVSDGVSWHPSERQPGDYGFVAFPGRPRELWICDPAGQFGRCRKHEVTEHEDGTVTVSPSIHDAPDGWHGWLERGVWRSV